MNITTRLIKKRVPYPTDDAAHIPVARSSKTFSFSDHLRHLHENAGDIPATLDGFGRCAYRVRRGWLKLHS
jgi:hypothetical protein